MTAAIPAAPTPARPFTEPLRELCVLALLAGNAVFLFLGFSGLFFVIDRWATEFGLRCAAAFSSFVGPTSIGLPIAAMLLATHVVPMIRRTRLVLITVLVELSVSALFGAVTFLGAFASDLSSVRATLEGTLWRTVWLAFLVLACIVVVRLWMGLFPAPKPRAAGYGGYPPPSYGTPYPGQPMFPQQQAPQSPHGPPAFQPGSAPPAYPAAPAQTLVEPTSGSGWPLVPPPPMPAPLVVQPPGQPAGQPPAAQPPATVPADATIRMSPATLEAHGDQTQKVSPPAAATVESSADGRVETRADGPGESPTQDNTPRVDR